MNKINAAILLVIVFLESLNASGVTDDSTGITPDTARCGSRTASVSLRSDKVDIRAYDGRSFLSLLPADSIPISEGRHILRYFTSDTLGWFNPVLVETIDVKGGEHVVKTVDISVPGCLTSEPYGATIRFRDSIIGKTPVLLGRYNGTGISLSKEGYREVKIDRLVGGERMSVILEPDRTGPDNPSPGYLKIARSDWSFPMTVVTGGTVISGSLAAYFKIRGDRLYADYLRTGNGNTLEKVRKFDLASGISLAVCEIGFFTLTYLIFSQ